MVRPRVCVSFRWNKVWKFSFDPLCKRKHIPSRKRSGGRGHACHSKGLDLWCLCVTNRGIWRPESELKLMIVSGVIYQSFPWLRNLNGNYRKRHSLGSIGSRVALFRWWSGGTQSETWSGNPRKCWLQFLVLDLISDTPADTLGHSHRSLSSSGNWRGLPWLRHWVVTECNYLW